MLRTLLFTTALLAGPTTAAAITGAEISGEIGTLENRSAGFDRLKSESDTMGTRGIRVGVGIVDHVTILGSWARSSQGSSIWLEAPDGSEQRLSLALYSNHYALGPKFDLEIGEVFYPYVTAQGMLFASKFRLDEDIDRDDNPGQVQERGLSPGFMATGGFELRGPQKGQLATVGLYVEAGYAAFAETTYDTLGTQKPGGFILRSGAGIRF